MRITLSADQLAVRDRFAQLFDEELTPSIRRMGERPRSGQSSEVRELRQVVWGALTDIGASSRWGNAGGRLQFAFIDASCPMDLISLGHNWFPPFQGLHMATGHSGRTTNDTLDSASRPAEFAVRTIGAQTTFLGIVFVLHETDGSKRGTKWHQHLRAWKSLPLTRGFIYHKLLIQLALMVPGGGLEPPRPFRVCGF